MGMPPAVSKRGYGEMASGPTAVRRHRRRLLEITFVVGSFVAAGLIAAGVVAGADQPSIASDRSDYAPGDTVSSPGPAGQRTRRSTWLSTTTRATRGPMRPTSLRPPTAPSPTHSTCPHSQGHSRSQRVRRPVVQARTSPPQHPPHLLLGAGGNTDAGQRRGDVRSRQHGDPYRVRLACRRHRPRRGE